MFFTTSSNSPTEWCFSSAHVIAELWALVILAPLVVTDLRALVSPRLVLVDASNDWMASVEADLPTALAREMARHKLTKAAWSKMLTPWKALQRARGALDPALEVAEDQEPAAAHPLWSALVRSTKFQAEWKQQIRRKRHLLGSDSQDSLGIGERAKQQPSPRRDDEASPSHNARSQWVHLRPIC